MKYAKKNWISDAIKKPGALHRQMGVPLGKTIPATKLDAAAAKGGLLGKRAGLAKTLKGFAKARKSESPCCGPKNCSAM